MKCHLEKNLGILLVCAFLTLTPATVGAHPHYCCSVQPACGHMDCNHHECEACVSLDTKLTPSTVQGKVVRVGLIEGRPMSFVELLTQEGEKNVVLVAPSWFLKDQDFDLKAGDLLTAEVTKIDCPQGGHRVALTLKSADGKTLRVRDEYGIPLWQRGHARGRCWR
jgi:hypothetical protein